MSALNSAEADFREAAATRILVFDGGYGTSIQKF
jgi:methionine synthase I (cobalamin-dependent)